MIYIFGENKTLSSSMFLCCADIQSRLDESDGSPAKIKKVIRPDPSLFTFDAVSLLPEYSCVLENM